MAIGPMFNPNNLTIAYGLTKIQEGNVALHKKSPNRTPYPHHIEPTSLKFQNLSHVIELSKNQPKAIVKIHKVSQSQVKERRA